MMEFSDEQLEKWAIYQKHLFVAGRMPTSRRKKLETIIGWDWGLKKYWTPEDVEFLTKNKDKPTKWLAEKLSKSEISIRHKKSNLGISEVGTKAFSKVEDATIIKNDNLPIERLAILMNRSAKSIQSRKRKLGLCDKKRTLKLIDLEFIKKNKNKPTTLLARKLGPSGNV